MVLTVGGRFATQLLRPKKKENAVVTIPAARVVHRQCAKDLVPTVRIANGSASSIFSQKILEAAREMIRDALEAAMLFAIV